MDPLADLTEQIPAPRKLPSPANHGSGSDIAPTTLLPEEQQRDQGSMIALDEIPMKPLDENECQRVDEFFVGTPCT